LAGFILVWYALFVIGTFPVSAQAPGDLLWEDRLPGQAVALATQGSRIFAAGAAAGENQSAFLVRAYDTDGELLWEDRSFGSRSGAEDTASTIAVQGNRVFAGGRITDVFDGMRGILRSYDVNTGELIWEDRSQDGRITDLTLLSSRLFSVTSHGEVQAYDAGTGEMLWSRRMNGQGRSINADHTGVYVAGTIGYGGKYVRAVHAFELETGEPLWDDALYEPGGNAFSGNGAVKQGVYISTGMDPRVFFRVRAFDSLTGELLWEDIAGYTDGFGFARDAVVSGNAVHIAGGEISEQIDISRLTVRTYDLRTGKLIWDALDNEDRNGAGTAERRVTSVAYAIAKGGDELFLAGSALNLPQTSSDPPSDRDMVVRSYDRKTGELRWSDRIDGGRNQHDFAWDVEALRNRIAVAGVYNWRSPDQEFVIRVYAREPQRRTAQGTAKKPIPARRLIR